VPGSVLGLAYAGPQATRIAIMAGLAVAVVFAARLALGRHPDASNNEPGPSFQWPAPPNPDDQIGGKPAEILHSGKPVKLQVGRVGLEPTAGGL
jgi:hypothetical protein